MKGVASLAPSKSSQSREFAKLQGNSRTAIFDGSFVKKAQVSTIAPPIQIYHPVFQEFKNQINKDDEPDPGIIGWVSKLVLDMGEIRDEKEGAASLRIHLEKILGVPVKQRLTEQNRYPDGIVSIVDGVTFVPVIVLEYKRALGEGECDPLVQGAYSALNYWVERGVRLPNTLSHKFTNCIA